MSTEITALYKNHKEREWHYMSLIGTGVRYFKRAYVISNINLLEEQWGRIITAMDNRVQVLPAMNSQFHEENLIDSVKMMICFENYLKGLLLKKGYIIHRLNRKVHKKFKRLSDNTTEPLLISEYKNIERSYTNPHTKKKTMRALKNQTLPFGLLLILNGE